MAEVGLDGMVEFFGQCFGCSRHPQEGQMRTQLLVGGVLAHAGTSPASVAPGKANAMISAMASRSTLGSVPDPWTRRARSARAACTGGLLALRSQGRSVLNWEST